jgi:hypothetical protein
MLRVAQAAQAAQVCTATSLGSLGHYFVLNLHVVCSGSKAEIDFGKVSFPLRVWWYYQVKTNLLRFPRVISVVFPVCKQNYTRLNFSSPSTQAAPRLLRMVIFERKRGIHWGEAKTFLLRARRRLKDKFRCAVRNSDKTGALCS